MNLTARTNKFELARNLLTDDSLSTFDNAASPAEVTETNTSFEHCLDAVALAAFPTRAELHQKRYVRRSLEKPDDMTMRKFMSCIQEINEHFPQFLLDYDGNLVQKLSESELVKIGECAIAEEWQDALHSHNADPLPVGVTDFIEFCQCLETLNRSHPETEHARKAKRKRSF